MSGTKIEGSSSEDREKWNPPDECDYDPTCLSDVDFPWNYKGVYVDKRHWDTIQYALQCIRNAPDDRIMDVLGPEMFVILKMLDDGSSSEKKCPQITLTVTPSEGQGPEMDWIPSGKEQT